MAELDEIMGGPFEVWIAPVGVNGEPAPDLSVAPAGNWDLLGFGGDKNISEDGITVAHNITVDLWRALGTTAPRKAFVSAEDLLISFQVADMRPETYAHALAKDPATAVATVAPAALISGSQSVPFYRGFSMRQVSLLLRGDMSPLGTFASQWWIPRCVQTGSPEIVIVKNAPQMLAFEFQPLYDTVNGTGLFVAASAVPTP